MLPGTDSGRTLGARLDASKAAGITFGHACCLGGLPGNVMRTALPLEVGVVRLRYRTRASSAYAALGGSDNLRAIMRSSAVVVALLSCSGGQANESHRRFSALDAGRQRLAMASLIESAGEPCGGVTRVFYRGSDRQGHAYYGVACANRRNYHVQLEPDAQGSAMITDCAAQRTAAKTDCFKPL